MNKFFWYVSNKQSKLKKKIDYYLSGTEYTVQEQFKKHLIVAIVAMLVVGMAFSESIRMLCLYIVCGIYFISLSTLPKRVLGSLTHQKYTPWMTYRVLKQCRGDKDYLVFYILQDRLFSPYDIASYEMFKQRAKENTHNGRFTFVTLREDSFFMDLLRKEYGDISTAYGCGIVCLTHGNSNPLGLEDLKDPHILEYMVKELEYRANGRPEEYYLGYIPE